MKRLLVCAVAALLLMLGCAAAEGFDTPKDIAVTYLKLCAGALDHSADLPERDEAFPALLEELSGFLDGESRAARDLKEALQNLREEGEEADQQAQSLLWTAAWSLKDEDIQTPFGLADLSAAAQYDLLPLESVAQFAEVFSQKAAAGAERFVMVCSRDMREALEGSTSYRSDTSMMLDVANQCGIYYFDEYYNNDTWMLLFDNPQYYPGTRILRAWQAGEAERLSEEERRTLDAALELANGAKGLPLERERYIHDALCDRITYYTDENQRERKDSAVGALLDGKADCDGYSDAFTLCASLAGLRVRYINGDYVEPPEGANPDLSHMWNLICLEDRWLTVDVTWDDTDGGITYTNYNLGAERAGMSHRWDERTQLTPLEPATLADFRDTDVAFTEIGSWDELYGVFRNASANRPEHIFIGHPQALSPKADIDEIAVMLYSTGVKSYSWRAQNALLELTDLVYAPEFRICDTVEDVAAYIEDCAARNVRSFNLYFAPELAEALFAEDHAALVDLISASPLESTRYTYNEEYRRVVIEDAEYLAERNLTDNLEDVRALLWQAVLERRESARFVLPVGVDFRAHEQELADLIYSGGVQSYSWSMRGRRVTFSDMVYYPEFALVSDAEELRQYLEDCKARGVDGYRAYCDRELYDAMSSDDFSAFFDLLRETGCQVDGISYNDAYAVLIVEAPQW